MSRFTGMARWLVLAMIAALAAACFAQTPTGTIRGMVTDPSGAVLANATVSITEIATGRKIQLQTTSDGSFVAPLLLAGAYKVQVSAPGFSTGEMTTTVQTGQVANASIGLKVGTTGTTVEVGAAAAVVQPDLSRSTVDGVITAQQIQELPLNARNFLELASQQPGVQIYDGGDIDPTKTGVYRTVSIIGRSGTGTRITIDGVDFTDETVGTTTANISNDAVQEFQLSQSSLDLSTSLTSSGAVNIITRSGGNVIHGSAFEYYRNQDMSARIGYNPKALPFHRHQTGFRLGGPFVKDKLFWFANWERTYQGEQASYTSDNNFPTIAGHNCTTGCFGAVPTGIRMATGRLDWNLTSSMRMFYRFGHDWNLTTGLPVPVSPFQTVNWNNNHIVGLDWSKGRFTHSFRFGYMKFNNRIISQSFKDFPFPTTGNGIPYNLVVDTFTLGPNGLAPQTTAQDNYDSKYDGSFVFGKHVLRYGLEVNRIIIGGFANFAGPLAVTGDFNPQIQAAANYSTNPLDYPLATFALGPDNGFFSLDGCDGFKYGCHRNTRIAWYVGDNYKPFKNLTLNFGTRWEYDTGYFNDESKITRPAFLNYWVDGAAKRPNMGKNKFGPQFGFAWDPKGNGRTVIRGGAYMAYEMNIYNNLMFDQNALIPVGIGPDVFDNTYVGNPDGTPVTPAQAGFAVSSLPAACQTATAVTEMNGGDYSCMVGQPIGSVINQIGQVTAALKNAYKTYNFDPNKGEIQLVQQLGNTYGSLVGGNKFKIPYAIQFNIGFQHEIKKGHLLTADFLYNHGVHQGFLGVDYECRKCANTLNAARAQTAIANALADNGWASIDAAIAAGATMADFNVTGDSVFQGRTPNAASPYTETQTINFRRARIMTDGGFTKYRGLQVRLQGNFGAEKFRVLRHAQYQLSYALGLAEGTNGSFRSEFLNNARNKLNPTSRADFGPVGEDRRHMLSGSLITDLPFGFRISQTFNFRTAPPASLYLPTTLGGDEDIFAIDPSGSGVLAGGGGPLLQTIPGTHVGEFGRSINSWSALNRVITDYNSKYAGTLTPAGKALVDAGLFTQAQLTALGAVMPVLQTAPTTNPWPFNNFFNMDMGISRPIKLSRIREGMDIEPWIQFFNVFNYSGLNTYGGGVGGLDGSFGSLNFDYNAAANQAGCGALGCAWDLANSRGRNTAAPGLMRMFQIGVRFNF